MLARKSCLIPLQRPCSTTAGCGCGNTLVAFHVGRGLGQALGRRSRRLVLHLSNTLFKYSQGFLLLIVTLA